MPTPNLPVTKSGSSTRRPLDPLTLRVGSHRRVWWRCAGPSTPGTRFLSGCGPRTLRLPRMRCRRLQANGCPVCSGRRRQIRQPGGLRPHRRTPLVGSRRWSATRALARTATTLARAGAPARVPSCPVSPQPQGSPRSGNAARLVAAVTRRPEQNGQHQHIESQGGRDPLRAGCHWAPAASATSPPPESSYPPSNEETTEKTSMPVQ